MKTSVKGLIFDYGGTIDTNGVHWGEVIRRAYKRFKIPVSRNAFRDAFVHGERFLGSQNVILPTYTFEKVLHIKLKLQFDFLNLEDTSLINKIANQCYTETRQETERSANLLKELKNHYPLVLVSNFYGNLRTVLSEFGLSNYFQHVIESAEVDIRKPDPEIYQLGIKAIGFSPEETVIIGDSYKNDIAPANILGCQSIWLKGIGWDDKDDRIEHPCIIKDFMELRDLLL